MHRIQNSTRFPQDVSHANERSITNNYQVSPTLPENRDIPHFTPLETDHIRHQELLTQVDHLMELIGNPVRTLSASTEFCSCSSEPTINALSTFSPNDVITSRNNLLEGRNKLYAIQRTLLRFPHQNLPEYERCLEGFSRAEEAFERALELIHNAHTPWSEYASAIQSASDEFSSFAHATQDLRTAYNTAAAAVPPGAYHISAQEATREGVFSYFPTPPPRDPVEAVSINLPIGHVTPLPEKNSALRLLKKAPYGPEGLPLVKAEFPIMMTQGLPIAEATIVTQKSSPKPHSITPPGAPPASA